MGLLPFLLAAAVVTGPITGGDRGQPFSAMPPADLTQAAYTEAEFFVSGTATAYKPAGTAGDRRRVEGHARHDGRLQGADARPPAGRREAVQRHRRRRMAERDGERRRGRRLHADAGGAAASGLRVGRRRRTGGGRELAAIRAQGLGQDALRIARRTPATPTRTTSSRRRPTRCAIRKAPTRSRV